MKKMIAGTLLILVGVLLIILVLNSCSNSETPERWENVDIEVKYMDSVKIDTLHLHLPLNFSSPSYEFDLYGDGLPYICLGYNGRTYVACNVRTYRILSDKQQ